MNFTKKWELKIRFVYIFILSSYLILTLLNHIFKIDSEGEFRNDKEAKDHCKNKGSSEYRAANKFCTNRTTKCGPPSSDKATVVLNFD